MRYLAAMIIILALLALSANESVKSIGKAIMVEASTHNAYNQLLKESTR